MEKREFRKLRVYVPRQPIVNQRPWLIAGLLLAFLVFSLAVCGYLSYKKNAAPPVKQNQATNESKN